MLTAYLKPSNYCNVGCEHCYLPSSARENKSKMSLETFRQTCKMLVDLTEYRKDKHVHILWHGGEPLLLLDSEFFRHTKTILNYTLVDFSESLQTSLIPYTSSHASIIHDRFASRVGTSIDFSSRKINGSIENYHDLWMKKVEAARLDGIEVIPSMVPTQKELNREADIVETFVEWDFIEFNIDRYNQYDGQLPGWPNNAEHSTFLIGLFDELMARTSSGVIAPHVNVITAAINGVVKGLPGDRWGTTCQSDFIVIDPDGSTNTCPDRMSHEKTHSNVDQGVTAFLQSDLRRHWVRTQKITHQAPHCQKCEFNHWCQSGCPITSNDLASNDGECAGYSNFLRHVKRYIDTGGFAVIDRYMRQFDTQLEVIV